MYRWRLTSAAPRSRARSMLPVSSPGPPGRSGLACHGAWTVKSTAWARPASRSPARGGAGDGAQQLVAEGGVPDQLLAAVVEQAAFGPFGEEAVVEAGAGEALEVLAVGVGAEDDAAAVEADALTGVGNQPRLEVVLAA